jgi:hypothetical protein
LFRFITEKVRSICHYYYIVDATWGTSQAINTSYQREPGEASNHSDNDVDNGEDVLGFDPESIGETASE